MIELYFIYNGHRRIFLGSFWDIQAAIKELKRHQASYSAITVPKFHKSFCENNIRIDYGACDCYYLLAKGEIVENEK